MQSSKFVGLVVLVLILVGAGLWLSGVGASAVAGVEPLALDEPSGVSPPVLLEDEEAVAPTRLSLPSASIAPEVAEPEAAATVAPELGWISIEVTVVSPDGDPVEGAAVRGSSSGLVVESEERDREAVTGPEGRAVLELPPGTAHIRAFAWAVPGRSSDVLECQGPGPFEITVQLEPTHRVRGRVLAADSGKPLAGATVHGASFYSHGAEPVETDAEGRFELIDWPLDVETSMTVTRDGYGMESVRVMLSQGGGWAIPVRFGWPGEKGWGDAPYVEVFLVPEKRIVGRLEGWSGEAKVEADGLVLLAEFTASQDYAEVRASGEFALGGRRSDVTHLVTISDGEHAPFHIVARPGTELDLGTVHAQKPLFLRGRAVDEQGRGLAFFPLELVFLGESEPSIAWDPKDGEVRARDAWEGMARLIRTAGQADADGRFELPIDDAGDAQLSSGMMYGPQGPRLHLSGEVDHDCGEQVFPGPSSLRRFSLGELVEQGETGPYEVTLSPTLAWQQLRFTVDSLDGFVSWWFPEDDELDIVVRSAVSGEVLGAAYGVALDDVSKPQ
jgi:hypothetical protein